MKNIFVLFVVIMGTIFLHIACDPEKVLGETEIESENDDESSSTKTESSSDYIWDSSDVKTITLNGSSISTPEMSKGASYSIYTGGSYSTTTNIGGYYSGGTYTPGTLKKSGTLSTSTTVNSISF